MLMSEEIDEEGIFESIDKGFGNIQFPQCTEQLTKMARKLIGALNGDFVLTSDYESIEYDFILNTVIEKGSKTFALSKVLSIENFDHTYWKFRQCLLKCLDFAGEAYHQKLLENYEYEVSESLSRTMQGINVFLSLKNSKERKDIAACLEALEKCSKSNYIGDDSKSIKKTVRGLFGNVLCRSSKKTKFTTKFIDEELTDEWEVKLRNGIKIGIDTLRKLELNIPDFKPTDLFEKCYKEGALETLFPQIPSESDLCDFIHKFKLIANSPSVDELLSLITKSFGVIVPKRLEKEQFCNKLMSLILGWIAQRKGTYLTQLDVKAFETEVKTTIVQHNIAEQQESIHREMGDCEFTFLPFQPCLFSEPFTHAESDSPLLLYLRFRCLDPDRDFKYLKTTCLKDESLLRSYEVLSENQTSEGLKLVIYFENDDAGVFRDHMEILVSWKQLIHKACQTVVVSAAGNQSAASFVDFVWGERARKLHFAISYDDLTSESQSAVLHTKLQLIGQCANVSLKDIIGVTENDQDVNSIGCAISVGFLERLVRKSDISIGSVPDEEHDMANIVYLGLPVSLKNLELFVKRSCLHVVVITNLKENHPDYTLVQNLAEGSEKIHIKEAEKFKFMELCQNTSDEKIFWIEASEKGDRIQCVYDPNLYVDRYFSPVTLKKDVFKECSSKDAFLLIFDEEQIFEKVTGIDVSNLKTINKGVKQVVDCNIFFVEEFVLAYPEHHLHGYQNYHLVSVTDSRSIKWIKSYNSIGGLSEFKEKHIFELKLKIRGGDLREIVKDMQGIILTGPAGAGKSACMNKMHKMLSKDHWVLKKDLKYFPKLLDNEADALEQIAIYLSNNSIECDLLKFLFLYSKSNEPSSLVHVMLDGFDEMPSSANGRKLLDTLKIVKRKVAVSLSTRDYFCGRLERALGKFAFGLSSFDKSQKQDFLKHFWLNCVEIVSPVIAEQEIRLGVGKLVQDVVSHRFFQNRLTGLPLEVRMLAEILIPDALSAIQDKKAIHLEIFKNKVDVFDEFMARKYDLYFTFKKGYELSNLDRTILAKGYDAIFTELALKFFYLWSNRSRLGVRSELALNPELESDLLHVGVITMQNRKLYFINDSYAEYFAARAIIKTLSTKKKNVILLLKYMKNKRKTRSKGYYRREGLLGFLGKMDCSGEQAGSTSRPSRSPRQARLQAAAAEPGQTRIPRFFLPSEADGTQTGEESSLGSRDPEGLEAPGPSVPRSSVVQESGQGHQNVVESEVSKDLLAQLPAET